MHMEMVTNKQIIDIIEKFFQAGKTKNLATLHEIQLNDARFSSFSDALPMI